MSDYPEYISEVIDTDKLKEDKPELFEEKATTYLSLSKPKEETKSKDSELPF